MTQSISKCDPYTGVHVYAWASNHTGDMQPPEGTTCVCGMVTYKRYCDQDKHKWREVYYGTERELCEQFYPYGCEPWAPLDEDSV